MFLEIGTFLISLIAFFYQKTTFYEDAYYIYCESGYITLRANKDLKNFRIMYNETKICEFDCKKGSSKICKVEDLVRENKTIFFVSEENYGEKMIFCYSYFPIMKLE